jgi:hypothetical protein
MHYVRKTQLRHTRTKNGDAQIARQHHRVLHYRVIQDVFLDASQIRIHLRRALYRVCLPLEINLRRTIRACFTDLIAGWSHCATNTRHAKGRASPITKKFEMLFNIARH